MEKGFGFRKKLIAQLVLGSLFAAGNAFAQGAVDLGTVQSNAGDAGTTGPGTASYVAPTQGSLVATQPQSIISQQYIQQNASATSNYTDIVNIAPGVYSVDPNGPGMMESQSGGPYIRGFHDGQYNVTFDGIPWGDSNDFTHHSTSYFMAQDLGGITVDRGPGDASNIGYATFGGTIAVQSKNPMAAPNFNAYATAGSWNTRMLGAEFDTGVMQNYGDSAAFVDYRKVQTDGYLTNSGQKRGNLFVKYVKPVSDNTVLTFVTMQNTVHQNIPYGATLATIAQYGKNYGLSANPLSQDYYGYNYDEIRSDFEYVGLNTTQGNWKIDNKLYTYAYYHNGYNGAGVGINQPNVGGLVAGDVPGGSMFMDYRSWGDILKTSYAFGKDSLDLGAWIDRQNNNRAAWNTDATLGNAFVSFAGGRFMYDSLTTVQPYAQYEWQATDALTVTPGLKYTSFTRDNNSPINQGTLGANYQSETWTKLLPAIVARYMIQPNWSAYAQYAEGFLAPNLNAFYKANANLGTLNPETTQNFQIGTTWKSKQLTLSGDVYKIDFSNQAQAIACGAYTCFQNTGGVKYNGIEGEATYVVGSGFSLYGNYAINNYSMSTAGSYLTDVAKNTATAGIIYNRGPAYASLIAKEIGSRYGFAQDANGNPIPFSSFTVTNFSSSYDFKGLGGWGKDVKVGFQINNIFNYNNIYDSATNDTTTNAPMYFVYPERNYELTLSIDM
jgi:iron complex outermembrane receptor protein